MVPSCYISLKCIIEQTNIYIYLKCISEYIWLRPHCGPLPLAVRLFNPKAGLGWVYLMYLLHSGDGSGFLDDSDAGDDGDAGVVGNADAVNGGDGNADDDDDGDD